MKKSAIVFLGIIAVGLIVFFLWYKSNQANFDADIVSKIRIINTRVDSADFEITNRDQINKIVDYINSQKYTYSSSRPKLASDLQVILYFKESGEAENISYNDLVTWKGGKPFKTKPTWKEDLWRIACSQTE